MSRARTLATVLGSDGTLGATEITTALGYTPVNKAGDTIEGIFSQTGLSTAVYYTGGSHGNSSRTYKIAKINSFYWGAGGTIVEVWRRYYSGFGYAKYKIDGHGATYYGPSFSSTLIVGSGSYSAITGSSLNIVNSSSGADGWGYYNILVTENPYYQSHIRITSSLPIYSSGTDMGTNRIVMYANESY